MSAVSMIALPLKVEEAITEILSRVDASKWISSAIELSSKYRLNRDELESYRSVFLEKADDVMGYLSLRTPATYAQLYGAMCNIAEILPSWKPISILDIGSGPGTAVWAGNEVWPSINKVTCLERDNNFCRIGEEIFKSALPETISWDWKTIDFAVHKPKLDDKFDLVTIGSVLNEMGSKQRNDILDFAYSHCKGVLLVVEPGTPYGFEAIKQASILLQSLKGILIAPYIDNFLPLKPVGFAQRIIRPEFHRRITQLQRKINHDSGKRLLPASGWEKAKYGYVAMSNILAEITPFARLIAEPEISKFDIELKILTKNGIEVRKILKRDKSHYKFAKKLKWGELIDSAEKI